MKNHYRTIWISDIHLGTRGCRADVLLDFLKHNTADTIYLVGDIIDMWALSRKIYFPKQHLDVMKRLLTLAKKHRVVYIRGNHDPLEEFTPFSIGDIEILEETQHTKVDGQVLLVCHGDRYDQVTRYAKWIAQLGDIGYQFLLQSNHWINWVRRHLGFGYWSLSRYAKNRVKSIVSFIGDYENAVVRDIRNRNYDGVVCGHIHHAEIKIIDCIEYYNSGDFVESCSALVETHQGDITIVYWNIDENSHSK